VTDTNIRNIVAGTTYLFTIQLVDIYGNLLIDGDNGDDIEIKALYQNHNDWPSPIGIPDLY